MAFKNQNVRAANQGRSIGANMPANNSGSFKQSLGAGIKSKFTSANSDKGNQVNTAKARPMPPVPTVSGKNYANLPANNTTNTNYTLGTTKHAPGGAPSYMQNKK